MNSWEESLLRFSDDWRGPVGLAAVAAVLFVALLYWEQARFILRSLRRNLLRSALTALATSMLVLVITLVWSVLAFLDRETVAKTENFKVLVSEAYQNPSRMPISYAPTLATGAGRKKTDYHVDAAKNSMFWAFYVGTLDPTKLSPENALIFFAMDPSKVISVDANGKYTSMMDDIDTLSDAQKKELLAHCREMEEDPTKVLKGTSRMASINKKVGERVKVMGVNYKDIDLEMEIAGVLPGGRYERLAVMNYAYLDQALQAYNRGKTKDQQHPMTEGTLALMFLRLPDMKTFDRVAQQITTSPEYRSPAVECVTLSSGIAGFLESYKDLLFGMRWLLVPSALITMSLVLSNAISISVRERRIEMAVLKVLGFSPNQIMIFVMVEALLVGCLAGLAAAWGTELLVNDYFHGVALPIAFFGKFFIDSAAPWWGLAAGAGTALAGSILPAWSARSVKFSEVFSKIA